MNILEHLILRLGEEGSEVSQAVHKTLSFGPDDRSPLNPDGPTNKERIIEELNHVLAVASMLIALGFLPEDWANYEMQSQKIAKVLKYVEYAKERGTIK